jgi:uncharacterized membrane-anchored protein YhcB (DUF1043 family)
MNMPLLIAIGAAVVGLLIGLLVGRGISPDKQKQRDLERNVDQLLQQQKDYQHKVAEHFTDTATLLNNMAESYRDVHNHLASGAQALCDDQTQSILRRLPDGSAQDNAGEPGPDAASLQPPLDYAPKASPFETGMLNEEFGLEKTPAEPEIEDAVPIPVQEKA